MKHEDGVADGLYVFATYCSKSHCLVLLTLSANPYPEQILDWRSKANWISKCVINGWNYILITVTIKEGA